MKFKLFSKKSGVSQAIEKVLTKELVKDVPEVAGKILVDIAKTERQKIPGYQLAYEAYLEKGYVPENEEGCLRNEMDESPDTTMINVYGEDKSILGTVTLNFNHLNALPCEELFEDEVKKYLDEGVGVELTRLAIKKNHRNSREILGHLFHSVFIYSHLISKVSRVFIEVNPRHEVFYKNLLGFESIGLSQKSCARVNGAPAVLLFGNMKDVGQKIDQYYLEKKIDRSSGFVKNSMPYEQMLLVRNKFQRYYDLKHKNFFELVGI